MADVTLYLTDWQKRMVKDYLGRDARFVVVPYQGGPIALYQALVPPIGTLKHPVMYLTDAQIAQVRDTFKITNPCTHMEIGLDLPLTFG
jgi:hypothetical protein